MLALCLLIYKCLLNEKRLSGVFLPVLSPLPPRVTGFSLVAAGGRRASKPGRASPCREAPRNSPGAAWKARFFLI